MDELCRAIYHSRGDIEVSLIANSKHGDHLNVATREAEVFMSHVRDLHDEVSGGLPRVGQRSREDSYGLRWLLGAHTTSQVPKIFPRTLSRVQSGTALSMIALSGTSWLSGKFKLDRRNMSGYEIMVPNLEHRVKVTWASERLMELDTKIWVDNLERQLDTQHKETIAYFFSTRIGTARPRQEKTGAVDL